MTSYRTAIESELRTGAISEETLAYFESRSMHDWYDYVAGRFLEEERAGRLTRAQLARRTHKSPAVISRLLSSPSNWTIATLSNLLLAISGEEPVPLSKKAFAKKEDVVPRWLRDIEATQKVPTSTPQNVVQLSDQRSSQYEPTQKYGRNTALSAAAGAF